MQYSSPYILNVYTLYHSTKKNCNFWAILSLRSGTIMSLNHNWDINEELSEHRQQAPHSTGENKNSCKELAPHRMILKGHINIWYGRLGQQGHRAKQHVHRRVLSSKTQTEVLPEQGRGAWVLEGTMKVVCESSASSPRESRACSVGEKQALTLKTLWLRPPVRAGIRGSVSP